MVKVTVFLVSSITPWPSVLFNVHLNISSNSGLSSPTTSISMYPNTSPSSKVTDFGGVKLKSSNGSPFVFATSQYTYARKMIMIMILSNEISSCLGKNGSNCEFRNHLKGGPSRGGGGSIHEFTNHIVGFHELLMNKWLPIWVFVILISSVELKLKWRSSSRILEGW